MTVKITVIGNLTADPELRYTQKGDAVASFSIASSERIYDATTSTYKDGATTFLRATVWKSLAEHVAKSLTKGQRVVAEGKLKQNSYKDSKTGETRQSYDLDCSDIGPSLKFGMASFVRSEAQQPAVAQQQQQYEQPIQQQPIQQQPIQQQPIQQQPIQQQPIQQQPIQQQPIQQQPMGVQQAVAVAQAAASTQDDDLFF